jgi:hypothetical protein
MVIGRSRLFCESKEIVFVTITETMNDLCSSGFTFRLVGAQVCVAPIQRLTAEQLAFLRLHKQELRRLLEAEAPTAPAVAEDQDAGEAARKLSGFL